jgi:uncharacterized iron-regulated membrane protein
MLELMLAGVWKIHEDSLKIHLQSGPCRPPRQIFLTASGLWLAVLFFLLVVLVATWLGRWWAAPAKAETEAEAAEEPSVDVWQSKSSH